MTIKPLKTLHVVARFDPARSLITLAYRDTLNIETLLQTYIWRINLYRSLPAGDVRGEIFDFRLVTSYDTNDLAAVQSANAKLHELRDLSSIPAAIIVTDTRQENMAHVLLNVTPDQRPRQVVHSMDEALAFIESCHVNQGIHTLN